MSQNIYNSLYTHSQYFSDEELLKKVKKECKCTVNDILTSQYQHQIETKKVCNRTIYLHTSIYDFGITQEAIRNEILFEKNKIVKCKKF